MSEPRGQTDEVPPVSSDWRVGRRAASRVGTSESDLPLKHRSQTRVGVTQSRASNVGSFTVAVVLVLLTGWATLEPQVAIIVSLFSVLILTAFTLYQYSRSALSSRTILQAIIKADADDNDVQLARQLTVLVNHMAVLQDRAAAACHPLLADEIGEMLDAAHGLWDLGQPGVERHLRPKPILGWLAQGVHEKFDYRVFRAQWAYRLNLPLSRENALNFAVANMSYRLERFDQTVRAKLRSSTPDEGGPRV